MNNKICENITCQAPFSGRANQKYCSDKCRYTVGNLRARQKKSAGKPSVPFSPFNPPEEVHKAPEPIKYIGIKLKGLDFWVWFEKGQFESYSDKVRGFSGGVCKGAKIDFLEAAQSCIEARMETDKIPE